MIRMPLVVGAVLVIASAGTRAAAQSTPAVPAAPPAPRAFSRASVFVNVWQSSDIDGSRRTLTELSTSFNYQLPEREENGPEYGVDMRYAASTTAGRPARVGLYEGFFGERFADGAAKVRGGHLWINELNSLGAVAGGLFEYAQPRLLPDDGRVRVGAFGGAEPNVLDAGYVPHVRKFGGYFAYDGANARRHSAGFAVIRNGALTERSVVTANNYFSVNRKLFVYQAAEFDVTPPAGEGQRGLAYFFATVRAAAGPRVDLQGNYNRGRAIDVRSLAQDVLEGRALRPAALDGLLYQSAGGRITVQAARRVHVYAGYSRDRTNRDVSGTGRTLIGGYAGAVTPLALDISASDSLIDRPSGNYQSRYVSVGRQLGRSVYVSGDYSDSLSIVRFSRGDGITVETRPHTRRIAGMATINLTRSISLLTTVERTVEDAFREWRMMSGLSFRLQ